jgi:uncharacterized protein
MTYIQPLAGGILIGIAASLMMLLQGRVFGISGIIGQALVSKEHQDRNWRMAVLLGLFTAGICYRYVVEGAKLYFDSGDVSPRHIIAGVLVGIGTQLGSGCTSGHGVCGISRFSIRSLVATLTFIATGAITVDVLFITGVLP